AVQEKKNFDFNLPFAAPSSEVVSTLCQAVQESRQVELSYQAWQAETTQRTVELYGLVCRSGFWYAVGYCHLREGVRVFRLDRVVSAEMCPSTYTCPNDF